MKRKKFQFLSGSISTSTWDRLIVGLVRRPVSVPLRFDQHFNKLLKKCRGPFRNGFSSSQVRSALQLSECVSLSSRRFVSVPLRFDQHFNSTIEVDVTGDNARVSVPLRFDQHFNTLALVLCGKMFIRFQFLSGSISTSTHRRPGRSRLHPRVSVPLRFDQHFNCSSTVVWTTDRTVSVPLRFDQHFNSVTNNANASASAGFSSSQVRSALQHLLSGSDSLAIRKSFSSSQVRSALQLTASLGRHSG